MFKVGDVVYVAFSPVQCGVILSIEMRLSEVYMRMTEHAIIQRLNGQTMVKPVLSLRSYTDLVESHKRKYEKQNATLQQLQDMYKSMEYA